MSCKVFIATSIDGYIADKHGGIDWLHEIENPNQIDMGYQEFMNSIDALVMGRKSFETVIGFGIPWPYEKPVYVLSRSELSIPEELKNKVFPIKGDPLSIKAQLEEQKLHQLYIDGGQTIQSFLREDLIEEMTLTTIPVLLGEGTPLFGELKKRLNFKCVETKQFLGEVSQRKFVRNRAK